MKNRGLILFFILIFVFVGVTFSLSKPQKFSFSFHRENLQSVVKKELEGVDGRYGIYIKNLKTGETFEQNGKQSFAPGSLYKLWVMGVVFQQIKDGKLKEDDLLPADVAKLNRDFGIPQGEAELKSGVLNFSVKSATEQMITISHNYAAMALTQKVGQTALADFLKQYGFSNSAVGDDLKTTPLDIGKFFEKLYKGEIIDAEYSQRMVEILARQTINDRIPKYLPSGTKIAHKTGDLGYFENDGGIVYSLGGDFIIVALTETNHPDIADEKIARISEVAYKYFNK